MAAALLLVVAFGVLMPLQAAQRQLPERIQKERQRLVAMEAMRSALIRVDAAVVPLGLQGEALRAMVEASARTSLAPATVTASLDGDEGVRLDARGVAMDRLLLWIDAMRRAQRLHLAAATLKPQAGGALAADLHFRRGGQ